LSAKRVSQRSRPSEQTRRRADISLAIVYALSNIKFEEFIRGGLSVSDFEPRLRGFRKSQTNKEAIGARLEEFRQGGLVEETSSSERPKRYRLTPSGVIGLRYTNLAPLQAVTIPSPVTSFFREPPFDNFEADYVVRAPGSTLLGGDYAVLFGRPAIVLPIPLYLYAGMNVTTSRSRLADDQITVYQYFGQAEETWQFDDLKNRLIQTASPSQCP
jgi:hypothetical protein